MASIAAPNPVDVTKFARIEFRLRTVWQEPEERAAMTTTTNEHHSDENRARYPNSVDAIVVARLRLRRKMLGLSQVDVGCMLGIAFQQVQKYEKGTNRIPAGRLYEMALKLEVCFTLNSGHGSAE